MRLYRKEVEILRALSKAFGLLRKEEICDGVSERSYMFSLLYIRLV